MKEYAILVINRGGKPYYLENYYSIYEAKNAILTIASYEEESNRPYYIDNDFFDNKYPPMKDLKYMCIVSREVTAYEKFYESENLNKSNDKILFFNFKKK